MRIVFNAPNPFDQTLNQADSPTFNNETLGGGTLSDGVISDGAVSITLSDSNNEIDVAASTIALQGTVTVNTTLSTSSNVPYNFGASQAGVGLSLKTTEYLDMVVNGVPKKIALVN